jgi:hypothetical protein
MSGLDPLEPPAPLPAGITGVPRVRRWDATALVDVQGLAGADLVELDFLVLDDGSTVGPDGVGTEALAILAQAVATRVDAPFAARAVRRGAMSWAVGARSIQADVVELEAPDEVQLLEVVVSPEGDVSASVDGEPVGELGPALLALEERGRARFESFVARADKVGAGRWAVTVEPI